MHGFCRNNRLLAAGMALMALHLPAPAHGQPSNAPSSAEAFARAFVIAVYPELDGRIIETFPWDTARPDRISVRVREKSRVVPPLDRIEKKDAELFEADARFVDGRLQSFLVNGTHVHSGTLRSWGRTIETGPTTLITVQQKLQALGGKFGPDNRDAFMKAVDLARFEPLLGRIQLLDAVFTLHANDDGASQPQWMLRLEAANPSGVPMCYGAFFEPFDGRLKGLISWLPGQRPEATPGRC